MQVLAVKFAARALSPGTTMELQECSNKDAYESIQVSFTEHYSVHITLRSVHDSLCRFIRRADNHHFRSQKSLHTAITVTEARRI